MTFTIDKASKMHFDHKYGTLLNSLTGTVVYQKYLSTAVVHAYPAELFAIAAIIVYNDTQDGYNAPVTTTAGQTVYFYLSVTLKKEITDNYNVESKTPGTGAPYRAEGHAESRYAHRGRRHVR